MEDDSCSPNIAKNLSVLADMSTGGNVEVSVTDNNSRSLDSVLGSLQTSKIETDVNKEMDCISVQETTVEVKENVDPNVPRLNNSSSQDLKTNQNNSNRSGTESTLGLKSIFSSTMNESNLNLSNCQMAFVGRESIAETSDFSFSGLSMVVHDDEMSCQDTDPLLSNSDHASEKDSMDVSITCDVKSIKDSQHDSSLGLKSLLHLSDVKDESIKPISSFSSNNDLVPHEFSEHELSSNHNKLESSADEISCSTTSTALLPSEVSEHEISAGQHKLEISSDVADFPVEKEAMDTSFTCSVTTNEPHQEKNKTLKSVFNMSMKDSSFNQLFHNNSGNTNLSLSESSLQIPYVSESILEVVLSEESMKEVLPEVSYNESFCNKSQQFQDSNARDISFNKSDLEGTMGIGKLFSSNNTVNESFSEKDKMKDKTSSLSESSLQISYVSESLLEVVLSEESMEIALPETSDKSLCNNSQPFHDQNTFGDISFNKSDLDSTMGVGKLFSSRNNTVNGSYSEDSRNITLSQSESILKIPHVSEPALEVVLSAESTEIGLLETSDNKSFCNNSQQFRDSNFRDISLNKSELEVTMGVGKLSTSSNNTADESFPEKEESGNKTLPQSESCLQISHVSEPVLEGVLPADSMEIGLPETSDNNSLSNNSQQFQDSNVVEISVNKSELEVTMRVGKLSSSNNVDSESFPEKEESPSESSFHVSEPALEGILPADSMEIGLSETSDNKSFSNSNLQFQDSNVIRDISLNKSGLEVTMGVGKLSTSSNNTVNGSFSEKEDTENNVFEEKPAEGHENQEEKTEEGLDRRNTDSKQESVLDLKPILNVSNKSFNYEDEKSSISVSNLDTVSVVECQEDSIIEVPILSENQSLCLDQTATNSIADFTITNSPQSMKHSPIAIQKTLNSMDETCRVDWFSNNSQNSTVEKQKENTPDKADGSLSQKSSSPECDDLVIGKQDISLCSRKSIMIPVNMEETCVISDRTLYKDRFISPDVRRAKSNSAEAKSIENCAEYALDLTCNPEMTILGEENIVMCQSVMYQFHDEKTVQTPSKFLNSEDANNSPIGSITIKNLESESPNSLESNNDQLEISGCAMDYSFSTCDTTAALAETFPTKEEFKLALNCSLPDLNFSTLTSNNSVSPMEEDVNVATNEANRSISHDTNKSMNVSKLIGSNLSFAESELSFTNIGDKTSDIKKFLQDSISSLYEKKTPAEEIVSLKENLFVVMDLLEKENNEFETFKKSCENEKLHLIKKIQDLEDEMKAKSDIQEKLAVEESLKIKEVELSELTSRHNEVEIKYKQSLEELQHLKISLSLTELELPQAEQLIIHLSNLGIDTNGLIEVDKGYSINLKGLLNALGILLTKHISFTNSFDELQKQYELDKNRLSDLVQNYHEEEKKVAALKEECDRLKTILQLNIENCNVLTESNDLLKHDLEDKASEIFRLKSSITSLTEQINILQGGQQNQLSDFNDKYNHLDSEHNELKMANELLSHQLQEKTLAYEDIKDSFAHQKEETDTLSSNMLMLKDELSSTKESYANLLSKYETVENELRIMCDMKNLYSSLSEQLDNIKITNGQLNTEITHKNSEIFVLTKENSDLKDELAHVKSNVESILGSHVPKDEYELLNAKFLEKLEELSIISSSCDEEKSKCAKLVQNLEEKQLSYCELMKSNEYLNSEILNLKNRLNSLVDETEFLKTEMNMLSAENESCEEELAKLREVEDKYSVLTRDCEDFVVTCEKLKTDLRLKDNQFEELKIVNENLTQEINSLNSSIENMKKTSELTGVQSKEEYALLKARFEEYHNLLDSKIKEFDSLEKINELIKNDLEAKASLTFANDSNMLTRPELNSLLLQIEEISLKSGIIGDNFKQKFVESTLALESLQNECTQIVNANEKYLEQVSSLNAALNEITESHSDLKTKYVLAIEHLDSERAALLSLRKEHDDLKTKHDEILVNISKLEEECSNNLRNKNELEAKLNALNSMLQEADEKSLNMKTEYDEMKLKYYNECTNISTLKDEHVALEQKYQEALLNVQQFTQFSLEKDEINEKNAVEINSLSQEVRTLEESLSSLKNENNDILLKYETECSLLRSVQNQLNLLEESHQETLSSLEKLKIECEEKTQINESLKNELSISNHDLNEVKENILVLRNDYEDVMSKYESECLNLKSLQEKHAELEEKYKEMLTSDEKLQHDYLDKTDMYNNSKLVIEELSNQIIQLNEQLSKVKSENDEVLNQLHVEGSKINEMKNQITELEKKYHESILKSDELEKICLLKEDCIMNFTEKEKHLNHELTNANDKLALLESNYSELQTKFESKSEEIVLLQSTNEELKLKNEEACLAVKKLDEDCLEWSEKNKRNLNEIADLQTEITTLKNVISTTKIETSELLQKIDEKNSNIELLHSDYAKLDLKFQEVQSNLQQLERECTAKTESNIKLTDELSIANHDLNEVKENILVLRNDYEDVMSKYESECLNLKSLQEKHSELEEKYKEMLSNNEKLQHDYLDKTDMYNNSKLVIEELSNQIIQLNEQLSKVKSENDEVLNQLHVEGSKINEMKNQITELEKKYHESILKSDELEKICLLKEDCIMNFTEKEKHLNHELTNANDKLALLESNYSELQTKFESKSEEIVLLQCTNEELKLKNEEACLAVKKLDEDCLEWSEKNKRNLNEIADLQTEITTLKNVISTSKIETSELLQKIDEKNSNIELLHSDYAKLDLKFQEVQSNLQQLERDCAEKTESNIKLSDEVNVLKDDLNKANEKFSTLIEEHNKLLPTYEEECSKRQSIENNLKELQGKYDEIVLNFQKLETEFSKKLCDYNKMKEMIESLNLDLNNEKDKVSALEGDYENLIFKHEAEYTKLKEDFDSKYEEALLNYKSLEGENSLKIEIIDRLENEIASLKTNISDAENTLAALRNDYDLLAKKFEDECTKCNLFEENLTKAETKFNQASSELADLQNDYFEKASENSALEEKNNVLNSELSELKTNICTLQSELLLFKEQCESQKQECSALKNELEILHEEKKQFKDIEVNYSNLKTKCGMLETELSSKCADFKNLEADWTNKEEKFNQEKCLWELEIEELTKKYEEVLTSFNSIKELNMSLEATIEQKHSELNTLNLKYENYRHFEDVINVLKSDFPILGEKFKLCENEFSLSENPMFDIFFSSIENVLKDFVQINLAYSENKALLSKAEEELDLMNSQMQLLQGDIAELKLESTTAKENHALLQNEHENLLKSHTDIKGQYDELLNKLNALHSENETLKSETVSLCKTINDKDALINNLSEVQTKYESLITENNNILLQLRLTNEENEQVKTEIRKYEKDSTDLRNELEKCSKEVMSLKEDNCLLKEKNSEYSTMYDNIKENLEALQKEKESWKEDKLKYEKDYQNSIDSLKKVQEELSNVQNICDEKMARFSYVLKEKESFENKYLSILKHNDELAVKIKELTSKIRDYEKSYSKFLELQSSYSSLNDEKTALEKQLTDLDRYKRENSVLKASLEVKDTKLTEITNECKELKDDYHLKSNEVKELTDKICSLIPGSGSVSDAVISFKEKLDRLKIVEDELKEEKLKSENLDEECNVLNEDLKYKETIIGDMYKDHKEEMDTFKDKLKKVETEHKESLAENESLKDKVKQLEAEVLELKTSEPTPCIPCVELKQDLQKSKVEVAEQATKITTLNKKIEEYKLAYKKKSHDYHKKILGLEKDLAKALKDNEEKKEVPKISGSDVSIQTDPLPMQLTGQSGIVHTVKQKEQEDKIHKIEKENLVLKKVCHNRLQTIKDLQARLESTTQSPPRKAQRTALEEIKNN